MQKKKQENSKEKKKIKKAYQKPSIETEEILEAGLGASCNGMSSSGGRKADGPSGCTILKT